MPELARTSSWPSPSSAASSEMRFSGVSSTSKIFTRSGEGCSVGGSMPGLTPLYGRRGDLRQFVAPAHPHSKHREKIIQVDRFGDVVGSASLDAFRAVAFHGLGRQSDDRKRP